MGTVLTLQLHILDTDIDIYSNLITHSISNFSIYLGSHSQ